MALPGRNDPCPCGSGKKFKHCHLVAAQPVTGITVRDRTDAIGALMKYSGRGEFAEVVAAAALMWMGDGPEDDPEDALAEIVAHDTSRETFFDWLFFDVPIEGRGPLAALFLERRGRSLHPRAEDFVRLMLGTHLRAYQVRESRPGEGVRLRDLWSGNEVWVHERSASHQLVVWDVLVARVHSLADGVLQMEGSALLLPAAVSRELLRSLKAEHRRLTRKVPDMPIERFFKFVSPVFHLCWYDEVACASPPVMRTAEGHALTASTLVFDVPRAGEAFVTVLAAPDFEPADAGTAVWLGPSTGQTRLLGDLRVDKGTLTLETMSRERAARGRARLEELLGPLRLAREEHREANARGGGDTFAPAGSGGGLEAIDAETVPDVKAWLDDQDRAWLDLEIPALDGATPRAAAKDRRLRPRLVDLLIDIENRQARLSRRGGDRDVSWLWRELGLKRP
jgi:hypothetical protein